MEREGERETLNQERPVYYIKTILLSGPKATRISKSP